MEPPIDQFRLERWKEHGQFDPQTDYQVWHSSWRRQGNWARVCLSRYHPGPVGGMENTVLNIRNAKKPTCCCFTAILAWLCSGCSRPGLFFSLDFRHRHCCVSPSGNEAWWSEGECTLINRINVSLLLTSSIKYSSVFPTPVLLPPCTWHWCLASLRSVLAYSRLRRFDS